MSVPNKIQIGCKTIDASLEGGIPPDSICLIYGEAETGKSTLAIQCAVNCARQGQKVMFIDCDGMFSAKRLQQIASAEFEKIAELIVLAHPTNFREQTSTIDRLPEYASKGFGLVIVDTITSLYRVQVAETPRKAFELNRELNRQLAFLAQFAKIQKIAVLVVSQVRTSFKEDYVSVEPVASRVLKFWAGVVLNLKPTENPRVMKAILEKTPLGTKSTTCYLQLEESGISEYMPH